LDPDNSHLWRMPRRRLEAEELRDAVLATGGLLETRMGGTILASSPFQDLSAGGLSRKPSLYESSRRSVYLPVLRGALHEMYRRFDLPAPAGASGDRPATTVATQSLFMMNSSIVAASCSNLAAKLLEDSRCTEEDRLAQACHLILVRPAEPDEIEEWSRFLET